MLLGVGRREGGLCLREWKSEEEIVVRYKIDVGTYLDSIAAKCVTWIFPAEKWFIFTMKRMGSYIFLMMLMQKGEREGAEVILKKDEFCISFLYVDT